MKTFRAQFTIDPEHYYAPVGAKIEMRHRGEMKKDGKRELIKDREYPIYEIIQSHREETEIERIVKRALEGDYTALNAMNGVYADISDAPRSLAEAQAMIINAKNEFYDLPIEIREKFNQNAEEYVAEMGSQAWMDKLGITEQLKTEKTPTTEPVNMAEVTQVAQTAGEVVQNIGGGENE